MKYDDECMYNTYPNLIKMLIQKDKATARDYLRSFPLSSEDLDLLNYLDQYTLEAVILNVLGMVLNAGVPCCTCSHPSRTTRVICQGSS